MQQRHNFQHDVVNRRAVANAHPGDDTHTLSVELKNAASLDGRHCAVSRWARKPELTASLFCKAMGWAEGSSQHRTYVNLRAGTVGEASKSESDTVSLPGGGPNINLSLRDQHIMSAAFAFASAPQYDTQLARARRTLCSFRTNSTLPANNSGSDRRQEV
jgi:hypothetical protein